MDYGSVKYSVGVCVRMCVCGLLCLCVSDIDECSVRNGNCSQLCRNTKGSYVCSCVSRYRLIGDGATCHSKGACIHLGFIHMLASGAMCHSKGACIHLGFIHMLASGATCHSKGACIHL